MAELPQYVLEVVVLLMVADRIVLCFLAENSRDKSRCAAGFPISIESSRGRCKVMQRKLKPALASLRGRQARRL
jgi:hypothetical protein